MTRLRTPLSPVGTTGCLRTRWRARVVAKEEKEKEQEEGTEITSIYFREGAIRRSTDQYEKDRDRFKFRQSRYYRLRITRANAFSINLIY